MEFKLQHSFDIFVADTSEKKQITLLILGILCAMCLVKEKFVATEN